MGMYACRLMRGIKCYAVFFVNSRQVRDKQLIGALRAAYSDFMPRDRFPAATIYINCRPDFVDVNVHPGKSEVRFRPSKNTQFNSDKLGE